MFCSPIVLAFGPDQSGNFLLHLFKTKIQFIINIKLLLNEERLINNGNINEAPWAVRLEPVLKKARGPARDQL